MTRKKKISSKEIKEGIDPSPIVEKLEKDNKALKRKNQNLKIQLGEDQKLFLELKDSIDHLEPSPPLDVKISKRSKKKVKISTALLLCDWHIGEVVEPDEIEGFNSYNHIIAKERVQTLVDKFCKWSILQGSADEAVVVCAGDFISGDIHKELEVTNEFPVPGQIVNAANLLAECVAELSRVFNKVRVEFIAADNHSRRSKKFQFKQAGLNSYNYLVGWIAQQQLETCENVEFELHTAIKALINIRGYKFLCSHGHQVRGWQGIPFYGLERDVSRESRYRLNMDTKKFHKVVLGHFHTPMYAPNYIMGGSLSGTSELDHANGRHSPPCQVAWLVHPEHGDYNFISFDL